MVIPRTRARIFVLACVLTVLTLVAPVAGGERLVFDAFIGTRLPNPAAFGALPTPDYSVPSSIAIDGQAVVYVADPRNDQVLVYDGSPSAPRRLTTLTNASGRSVTLSFPVGVAVDLRNDDVWIANTRARQLVKIDKNGSLLLSVGFRGLPGLGVPGSFEGPVFVAVDAAGNVYVTDDGGALLFDPQDPNAAWFPIAMRIQKFRSNGTFVRSWGSPCFLSAMPADPGCNTFAPVAPGVVAALGDGQFGQPGGIAVDSAGHVYVADTGNDRIQKFDTNGQFLTKWGSTGSGNGGFRNPRGVALDFADNVYVADGGNDRIQKFDSLGGFLSKEGSPMPVPPVAPGLGSFHAPSSIATEPKALVGLCLLLGLKCQKVLIGEATTTPRVLQMDAVDDADNDGLLAEVDSQPAGSSVDFGVGDTLGRIRVGGSDLLVSAPTPQSESPRPFWRPLVHPDTVRITTSSTPVGGTSSQSAQIDWLCASASLTELGSNTSVQIHCSVPAMDVLTGQAELTFRAADGTTAVARMEEGDGVVLHQDTSAVEATSGSPTVVIGGATVTLTPGQKAFADTTAPTTSVSRSPAPNANGSNNTNVTVTLTAADNYGGSGVKEVQFSLAGAQSGGGTTSGATAMVQITADGVTTLRYVARDHAGNEAAKSLTIWIDKSVTCAPWKGYRLADGSPTVLRLEAAPDAYGGLRAPDAPAKLALPVCGLSIEGEKVLPIK